MKQLHKNISFTSLHQFIVTALAFVLLPVAARRLGVDNYGLYTLATTLGFFVSLFADLGVSTILTREISKHPKIAGRFFARVMALKLILTVFAVVLLFAYLGFSNYEARYNNIILVFAVAAVLGSFSTTAFGFFRGVEKMQFEAVGVSLDKFISVLLGITLLLLGFGIEYFIWSFVISNIVLFIYTFRVLYKKFIPFEITWRPRQSRTILLISIYLGVSAFLSMAYNYLDILMLDKMDTLTNIGYYSAAHRVLMLTRIFPTILMTAFLPQLSAHHTDKNKLSEFFTEGVSYLILIILPLVPATVVLANPIIEFVCGSDYAPGAIALRILAFSIAAQMLNIFFVPLYIAVNQQKKIVHFQIVGLLVNVGLNFLLIPRLSFVGASIAAVATESVIFMLIFSWMRRRLGVTLFPPLRYTLKGLFSTAVMMIFIFMAIKLKMHITLVVAAALAVYVAALELTNTLRVTKMARAILAYKAGG